MLNTNGGGPLFEDCSEDKQYMGGKHTPPTYFASVVYLIEPKIIKL